MSPKVSKEHQQQRRTKILEAAKQVFIENGYERTTMKHVMDASNVSRGGLYQYFANKEDLFEAILADSLSRVYDETRKKLDQKVDSYWELLLLRLFGESRVPNDKMDPLAPSTLEFFITGRNDSRRRKYGKERYHFGIKIYSDVIKEGQKNKEFSTKYDSEIVARMIVSFIDGLALDYAIISNEELMMREQSILFVEFLKMALEV
ncbi:TetR/AcrR family transcriptional regulator [Bacillus sp. AFS017336]|uniref:TetR/AcrR family transcriptional regulator n=1 Tax=Bacillus sp. AFS017336 TaxID=2033489 RepID=UPI000BF0EE58|nr:TetR/AcrR family transcriptional regulator [Bacillus sp. AFS017336]PEK98319.1 TetR family transcriptional regulator [Bacillus sp. AFS017336]